MLNGSFNIQFPFALRKRERKLELYSGDSRVIMISMRHHLSQIVQSFLRSRSTNCNNIYILELNTKHVFRPTDLCRVVIAAFLVHQITRVFNVISRAQFTRYAAAVVRHALPLHETFYLAQLAVWRRNTSDEVPFQSFSNDMVNKIHISAVIC